MAPPATSVMLTTDTRDPRMSNAFTVAVRRQALRWSLIEQRMDLVLGPPAPPETGPRGAPAEVGCGPSSTSGTCISTWQTYRLTVLPLDRPCRRSSWGVRPCMKYRPNRPTPTERAPSKDGDRLTEPRGLHHRDGTSSVATTSLDDLARMFTDWNFGGVSSTTHFGIVLKSSKNRELRRPLYGPDAWSIPGENPRRERGPERGEGGALPESREGPRLGPVPDDDEPRADKASTLQSPTGGDVEVVDN